MPCVFADEHCSTAPAGVERSDLEVAIDESLFVKQPVGREKNFPVNVPDNGTIAAKRDVERAVVDRVLPDLVEAEPDIHRLERGNRFSILLVEIADESSCSYCLVPDAALEEIPADRSFRENCNIGPRVERVHLCEDASDLRDVCGVVAFTRLELNQRKVDGAMHRREVRTPLPARQRARSGSQHCGKELL